MLKLEPRYLSCRVCAQALFFFFFVGGRGVTVLLALHLGITTGGAWEIIWDVRD